MPVTNLVSNCLPIRRNRFPWCMRRFVNAITPDLWPICGPACSPGTSAAKSRLSLWLPSWSPAMPARLSTSVSPLRSAACPAPDASARAPPYRLIFAAEPALCGRFRFRLSDPAGDPGKIPEARWRGLKGSCGKLVPLTGILKDCLKKQVGPGPRRMRMRVCPAAGHGEQHCRDHELPRVEFL